MSVQTERRGLYSPFDLNGGQPGALEKNALQRCEKSDSETLPAKTQIDVQPGDILTIQTPGGGGCGISH